MYNAFFSIYLCLFTGSWRTGFTFYSDAKKISDYFIFGDGTDIGFFGWLGQIISHSQSSPENFWGNMMNYVKSIGTFNSLIQNGDAVWVFVASSVCSLLTLVGIGIILYKILKWAITSWVYKFR